MERPVTRVKLPYIHEYTDRHGRLRRYVRRPGQRKIALPGLPGSEEFMVAYASAIDGAAAPCISNRHKPGTVGALVASFLQTVDFKNLAEKSQQVYRLVLERFAEKDGHRLVRDLPREKARKIIEEVGSEKRGMGNLTLAVLRKLFEYAIDLEIRKDNPFARIKRYKGGRHHTWTDEELAQYEAFWPIGTDERLAYETLLLTTQRTSDAVKLLRGDIRRGFTIRQKKTKKELTIPAHPRLQRVVKKTPRSSLYIICDRNGAPRTANALGKFMERSIRKAGLPDRCVAHGLRKAGMRLLAEGGSTAHELKSMSGHTSIAQVQDYTERVDQAKLAKAAIRKIPIMRRRKS
jgi:integrase